MCEILKCRLISFQIICTACVRNDIFSHLKDIPFMAALNEKTWNNWTDAWLKIFLFLSVKNINRKKEIKILCFSNLNPLWYIGFMCSEPLEVDYFLRLSSNGSGATGVEYSLICDEGFSANGTMLCNERGQWLNKAVCSGFLFLFYPS